ncbi:hypothetical protein N7501_010834 [Penicillium viridicatum]|nr:hypothetical protein N7501_010834 [Penicillium viridicatum]
MSVPLITRDGCGDGNDVVPRKAGTNHVMTECGDCAPERFAGFAYCSVPEAEITGCLRQLFLALGQVSGSEH